MSLKLPRRLKWLSIALLGLLLLGGIAGLSARLWLRSEKFNQFVAGEIKAKLLEYGLRGEIGSFGFAWDTQTARLKDLKIYNQQTNQLIASVGGLELQTEIQDLYAPKLSRNVVLKKLSLDGVEVFIEIDEQGKTNLEGVRNAPPKSKTVTFDSANLLTTLTGAVHFKDRQHKIESDLANLNLNARLSPQTPDSVALQLTANDSRARFENRDLNIGKLNLTARVAPALVEIEQVSLDSTVGALRANGKLEDFSKLRYGFDVEANLRLAELAQFAFPTVALRGPAAVNGKVEGEGGKYDFKGSVRSEELSVENTKLRGVELAQVTASGDAGKLNLTLARAGVQSLAVDIVQIGGVTLGEAKGEIAFNGKNTETRLTAPVINVATVAWPESKLTNLRLANVTTNIHGVSYEGNADANLGGGNISGAPVQSATAKAAFDNAALTVSQIKASALGGTIEAEYVLPMAKGAPQRVKGSFADLLTAEVLAVAKVKDAPISGQTSGDIELSFSGGNPRALDGKISARFEGKANEKAGDLPLTGNVAVTAARGVFTFDQFQLATGATKLTATGTLSADGESDLRVSLLSPESEQLVQIARSFEAARPFIIENEPQLLGELKFDGRVTGRIENPVVEGDVSAATVGLRDALLGALSGHVTASATEFRVRDGLISTPSGGAAKFDLFAPLDPKAETGNLTATIDRISLETILAAAGAPNAERFVSGEVSGSTNLTGLPGKLIGSATVNLNNGTVAEQPAQLAIADLKFDGRQALLERLEVRLPQTRLNVTGNLNLDDYAFQTQGKINQISLASLAESFELKNTAVEGFADAEFQVSGKLDQLNQARKAPEFDWESLKIELSAIGQNVRVNGRDAGALRLTAHTSPGGRIDAELVTGILAAVTKDKAFKPEILKAGIEMRKQGRPVVIESELTDLDLSPIIATFAPDIGSQVRGAVTGKLRVEGPTADDQGNTTSELLRGGLTLTAIKLDVLDSPVNIQTPLAIALDRQRLTVPTTPITGQGIDLRLGGAIGLGDDVAMNFALNGLLNLERLPTTTTEVFLSGAVNVDARLTGTAEKPVLNGTVGLNGFGLSTRELPIFLSNGKGNLRLTGDQITLENFSADANDGRLTAGGTTKLAGFAPAEWKYGFKIAEAAIYYEEFNATINGDLTLTGTPQGQRLDGSITVPQGEYATRVDLDNLVGGGTSTLGFNFGGAGSTVPSTLIPPVSLNVRVEARNSLLVRGNQINAAGSALLTIGGTLSDPDPRGRIETESGLVRFRGQRYEITRGTLDFPAGSDQTPVLDLVAQSEVSGYRVYLDMQGKIDTIELKLRAEPQLTRDEIIALITTGRTEAGTITSQDPLRQGFGAAASLLTSGLISKPTEQLLGLSRFQIDPILRPNSNPAARLTVGQQLSRNIYLSYSTNLGTDQDQTALAEYTLSNRFSTLATYTQGGSAARQGVQDGAFTIELRGRQRFSLGFQPTLPPVAGGGNSAARSTRPKFPAAQVTVEPVPKLKLNSKTLRDLLPVMTQGFSRSLARLGERRLNEYLQEQGYFFAEVRYRCEPVDCAGPNLEVAYDIEPNQIYDLKEIRIEGTRAVRLGDVEGELLTRTESVVGGIPFLKDLPLIGGTVRGLTSNSRLSSDENIIRARLVDLGFRNARVQARLAFKPDNDDLIVIFDVQEGVQAGIADIVLRGNAVFDAKELREAIPIRPGEAFSLTRARAGAQQIRRLYAERGYLESNATLQIADLPTAGLNADSVQLIYEVNEGERAVVSEIEINGLTKTGPGWVRRYLAFAGGDLLTPAKMAQTQRDLYATNAFREVTVRAEPVTGLPGNDEGSAHKVTINLTEAKPLLFVYGLGYSTDDGARGLIELANTNLGGTLDALSLRLRGSRREQFAQLSFTDLRPFGTRLPTTISMFYNRNANLFPAVRRRQILDGERQDIPNIEPFGLSRFAAFIQTERKLNPRTSLRLRYNLERAKLFNLDNVPEAEITRNERAIRLGMFSFGVTRDTRDNPLNSTRGQLISADYSLAANILGGNESFNKFFATYQSYKTFEPGNSMPANTTLAFSARIGLANAFRDADRNGDGQISDSETRLPISERFFSGGATTLRGFRFETAGPQDVLFNPNQTTGTGQAFLLPTLVPVGGDAQAVFNFELRYPLSRQLRLVPFYDLGNVFRRVSDFSWAGMTHTVGAGLRFNTPLGPVGVDYGFLLDPPAYAVPGVPGAVLRQPRGSIHIRFGQSF